MGLLDFLKDDQSDERKRQALAEDASDSAPTEPAPTVDVTKPDTPPTSAPSVADYLTKKFGLTPYHDASAPDDAAVAATATATPQPAAKPRSLADRYKSIADDDSGVRAARTNAADYARTANLMEGLSTMFAGSKSTDSDFYNRMRTAAQGNADRAVKDKQQKLADVENQGKLAGEDNQLATQQRQMDQAKREDNKDSPESQLARDAAKAMYPDGNFDGMSATQILTQRPMIKDLYDQRMKQEDMRLRWAQLAADKNNKRDEKDKDRDIAFGKHYTDLKGKYIDASAKIDHTLDMVDQATTHGGVVTKLVPLDIARQIAGRLNPQEIAAAGGDPSIIGRLGRMISTAESGKMSGLDADEFRALLNSQKKNLADAWTTKSQTMTYTYSKGTKRPLKDVVDMVENPYAPNAQGATTGSAPTAASAPDAPKRSVSAAELKDYATKHKMEPAAAADYLKSQKYSVEGY